MLENRGLSLKGIVENISFMGNISIRLKAHGKTRAQHVILENRWPPRERREEGAGKHFQTPQSDSVTFPFQGGTERGQKKYPSELLPHVKIAPSLGDKTLVTNPVL